MSPSTLFFWALITIGKAVIFGLAYKTRHKAFTLYIGFSFLKSLVLWGCNLRHFPEGYYYIYYVGNAVETLLGFAFIAAICKDLFAPYWILPRKTVHFTSALVTFGGCALVISAVMFRSSFPSKAVQFCRTIDEFSLAASFSALAVTFLLARFLTIPWRKQAQCLASGVTLYLGIELALSATTLSATCPAFHRQQWLHPAAYLISEIIWLMALLQPEPLRPKPTMERLLQLAEQLQAIREQ